MNHDSYEAVPTDAEDVLGLIGKDHEPIQNRDAFAFFDALVHEHEAVYETAGVLGLGDRVWILAKLPGYIKVHGNDIVNKYLLLTSGHEGGSHVRVKLTPIRVVCNNTLTSALQGAGEVHIRYTHNATHGVKQAVTLLGLSKASYEQLDITFNGMAMKKITDGQLREYLLALVPDNETGEDNSRTEKIRNDVLQLHDSGRGAHLSRGTLWGAFNSVTEYADYRMLAGDATTRLNSIWFGRGEQLKLKAFRMAERIMQN